MVIEALEIRQTSQFFPLKGSFFYQLSSYWTYFSNCTKKKKQIPTSGNTTIKTIKTKDT